MQVRFLFVLLLTAAFCEGRAQSFLIENKEAVLIGSVKRQLLESDTQFNWFRSGYAAYNPDAAKIRKLKSIAPDIRVEIYMGSWCEDTRIWLPRFFKIADMIGIKPENIRLTALSRAKTNESNFPISGVDRVPFFTFFHKQLESGKIIESPSGSIEEVMINIYKPFL